jgi:ribosomal protein S18 acetylase RimI-like enzyme
LIAPDAHAAVVEALEANQWALMRAVALRGGAELVENAEILWTVTGLPVPAFNAVLRTSLTPDRVDDAIDATAATIDSRGFPWSWYVGPASLPLDLGERLEGRGFVVTEQMPGMAAALDDTDPDPGPLRFEQVREEPSLEAFGTLMGLAFEMPPNVVEPFLRLLDLAGSGDAPETRNFIALDDGEPIACGTLVLAAGVAGLYNIGVQPDRQRQGIGAAMTAALMAEGRASGAETAILWASAAGTGCYRGLGFEERCRLTIYERR